MSERREVPCGGCTLCCKNDMVRLLPGDDPASYMTEPHPLLPGMLMLAHKPNGDCIYLGEGGCTIHDRAPTQCREMDCRVICRGMPFEASMAWPGGPRMWMRGWELIEQEKGRTG